MSTHQLSASHEALIRESGIDVLVAQERGYRTVTTKAELKRVGFSEPQQLVPTLLIPIRDMSGEVASHQHRPDHPRFRSGKAVKYETPNGSSMLIDVPLRVRGQLADPKRPLFITEGARKADSAASRGLCCVALLGVWNWRGKNSQGGKAALADWERIALNDREVYIVFDSDVVTKPQVCDAMKRLKAFLEVRKAKVRICYLPAGDGGAKTGLDDFFASGRTVTDLMALAADEVRNPHGSIPDTESRYRVAPEGIYWLRTKDEEAIEVPLSNFGATIDADILVDNGVSARREFEITATLKGRPLTFRVLSTEFERLHWPTQQLGATALITPGQMIREHLAFAIKSMSLPEDQRVFAHTGWTTVNGCDVYLHAGGALGPDGPVESTEIELPASLKAACLVPAPDRDAERRAIRASLELLRLARPAVTAPLLAATYLAPVARSSFSVFLVGRTGTFKTETATLFQQHFGADFTAKAPPAGYSSTANALEELGFIAKDMLLLVDDFVPGSAQDGASEHRKADRFLRGIGNGTGRTRSRTDGSLRETHPVRASVVSTGEDLPVGQSLRARLAIVSLRPGDVTPQALTRAQEHGRDGTYSEAMASFVIALAKDRNGMLAKFATHEGRLKSAVTGSGAHRRTPDVVARLGAGLHLYLDHAFSIGAITPAERDAYWSEAWNGLQELGHDQTDHLTVADPATSFLTMLNSAIVSRRAHLADPKGGAPENPGTFGWRPLNAGGPWEHISRADYIPQGRLVGWIVDDGILLDAQSALAAVHEMGRNGAEALTVTLNTLKVRLYEGGHLVSVEHRGGERRYEIRRSIGGRRLSVLHIARNFLYPQEPAPPAQGVTLPTRMSRGDGPEHGPESNATPAMPAQVWPAGSEESALFGPVGPDSKRTGHSTQIPPVAPHTAGHATGHLGSTQLQEETAPARALLDHDSTAFEGELSGKDIQDLLSDLRGDQGHAS